MGSEPLESSRRGFFKQGLGLGLGLAGVSAAGEAMADALAGYQPKALTQQELGTLKAVMARLIPADEAAGGAVEAGAHVYVDRALAAFHARHLPAYRAGLAELEQWARNAGHAAVAAMPVPQADALIGRLERGELAGGKFADGGSAFFKLLTRHTLEGFLCDPMYGGNQDFVGWKVIGFKGVQLYYPPEAQQLNGKDDRRQRSIADFGGSPKA